MSILPYIIPNHKSKITGWKWKKRISIEFKASIKAPKNLEHNNSHGGQSEQSVSSGPKGLVSSKT